MCGLYFLLLVCGENNLRIIFGVISICTHNVSCTANFADIGSLQPYNARIYQQYGHNAQINYKPIRHAACSRYFVLLYTIRHKLNVCALLLVLVSYACLPYGWVVMTGVTGMQWIYIEIVLANSKICWNSTPHQQWTKYIPHIAYLGLLTMPLFTSYQIEYQQTSLYFQPLFQPYNTIQYNTQYIFDAISLNN